MVATIKTQLKGFVWHSQHPSYKVKTALALFALKQGLNLRETEACACFHCFVHGQHDSISKQMAPPHIKIQRAKAIIMDGVELWLKECARCGREFYGE